MNTSVLYEGSSVRSVVTISDATMASIEVIFIEGDIDLTGMIVLYIRYRQSNQPISEQEDDDAYKTVCWRQRHCCVLVLHRKRTL